MPSDQGVEFGWMPSQLEAYRAGEDWTGVTSTAQRRKLQNRLNQRAYRRRRKLGAPSLTASANQGFAQDESHVNDDIEHVGSDTPSSRALQLRSQRAGVQGEVPPLEEESQMQKQQQLCRNGSSPPLEALWQFARLAYLNYARGALDLKQLPQLTHYNLLNAMNCNAQLLDVADLWMLCDSVSPYGRPGPLPPPSSSPSSSLSSGKPDKGKNWPPNMRPTTLQHTLPHHPWIDLFPLPRLRDNMLRATRDPDPAVDEDALCMEVAELGGGAVLLVWGDAWDPWGWEVSPAFWAKYGWLLEGCAELIEATNYWRARRGEKRLPLLSWGEDLGSSSRAGVRVE